MAMEAERSIGDNAAVGGPSIFQGTGYTVHINGGYFNSGESFNSGIQFSEDDEVVLKAILQAIPNHRNIHATNLSKATTGTGPCFSEWREYRQWLVPRGYPKIMWGTGMLGAGKSTLASIVVNEVELCARASDSPICVAYIYFGHSDHTNATVSDFLLVLVKQTIERHPHCLPVLKELYARHIPEATRPSEAELLRLLHCFSQLMGATFYFLEGLDKTPSSVQVDLVEQLSTLNVKLFITSRFPPTQGVYSPDAHRFVILAQDHDLNLHITKEIAGSPVLERTLNQGGSALREKVTSTIKQTCGGMFLHASLQLAALRGCTSAYEVRRTLEDFPSRIEDIYQEAWRHILGQPPDLALLAKHALVWLLCATRPLTIDELRHAIATSPDTHKFDRSRLVDGVTLIYLCRGLVDIEEETNVVHFVHGSAKDAVESLISESCPCPHSLPALVCMALLAESGFQRTTLADSQALETTLKASPLLAYAYEAWPIHARESLDDPSTADRLAHFIQGCSAFPVCLSGQAKYYDTLEPLHMIAYFDLPISAAGPSHLYDPNQRTRVRGVTPLILAVRRNSLNALTEILSCNSILANAFDKDGFTPLSWAMMLLTDLVMATVLLNHPKIDVNALNASGTTALSVASVFGAGTAVAFLLTHREIKPNHVDSKGFTPLMFASCTGRKNVVEVLLADSRVEVHLRSKAGETALDLAQKEGHGDIVELLRAHLDRKDHHLLGNFLSIGDQGVTNTVLLMGIVLTVTFTVLYRKQ
ncbi:hypothetical protein BKA70DRAFT_1568172 [Coprinopsis sp. MPI-PUGE-AT-0042]|nr:hypothetical protein BKA70DRAFT_1576412 [Coprinopsis sp. MPI-PUGE-AT-0042]KAH6901996.1 hypothetical protein BKA70DRAFT_1568172 [Coprinopsis sp. MPI-PUGE-AT-0042]